MDNISQGRFMQMLKTFCSSVSALKMLRPTAAEAVIPLV
jgi:hypothetical protein